MAEWQAQRKSNAGALPPLVERAEEIAEKLAEFLEFPLDLEATVRQVDGKLYRQRAK